MIKTLFKLEYVEVEGKILKRAYITEEIANTSANKHIGLKVGWMYEDDDSECTAPKPPASPDGIWTCFGGEWIFIVRG